MTNGLDPHKPAEYVMTGAAVNLTGAGILPDQFEAAAPLCACRLCGAVLQTGLHRNLYRERLAGRGQTLDTLALEHRVIELGTRWRKEHERKNHTSEEVEKFARTGHAFTPEAANILAPFGIVALGNMTQDIVDGMFEASRAPDLTHLQGGE